MCKKCFDYLLSPWVIAASIFLGILLGSSSIYDNISICLNPIGDIYLLFLQMCIIPVISTAIVLSIGEIIRGEKALKKLVGTFKILIIVLMIVSILSLLIGLIFEQYMQADNNARAKVGQLLEDKSVDSLIKVINIKDKDVIYNTKDSSLDIVNFIPNNIFTALSKGEILKIVFFFVIFGIMLKFLGDEHYENVVWVFRGVKDIFNNIIKITMYFLPLGLFSIVSKSINNSNGLILNLLGEVVFFIILTYIIIFLVETIIMWRLLGGSYFEQFRLLKEVIIISFVTRSDFAATSVMLSTFSKDIDFDKNTYNIAISLGVIFCRCGTIVIYIITVFFGAYLYDYSWGIKSIIILVLLSMYASFFSCNISEDDSSPFIRIILLSLGIPCEIMIVIFIMLNSFVSPFSSLINIYSNSMSAYIVSKKHNLIT